MSSKLEGDPDTLPIKLTVENNISHVEPQHYDTTVIKGALLVSALRRLHESNKNFTYGVTYNQDFGLFLESVNGVRGNEKDYWLLLSKKTGKPIELDVGIGSYEPEANEEIILRFTKWSKPE